MDRTPGKRPAPNLLEWIAAAAGLIQIVYALASGIWVWLATGAAILIGTALQYLRRVRLMAGHDR